MVTVHPTSHLEPVQLVERGDVTQATLQAYATREIPAHVRHIYWSLACVICLCVHVCCCLCVCVHVRVCGGVCT